MNASQIATYDTFKRRLLAAKSLDLHDGLLVHTLASSAAGTVATTACSPFDVLKSRVRCPAVLAAGRGEITRTDHECEGK